MFTKQQKQLLSNFADSSDRLFELGIITTDSYTGEIAEYIACKHFKIQKSKRVTKSIDGICKDGYSYQIKSKVLSKNNYSCTIKELDRTQFDYLVIVYFDLDYNPLKILKIPSHIIQGTKFSITTKSDFQKIEVIEQHLIKIPVKEKKAILDFAESFNQLLDNGLVRSRHIVGDIGETYACKRLNLTLSVTKNQKGFDAVNKEGFTFEIKTRRVYESGRRNSESRRINNLTAKNSDYLIIVTLDRNFNCSGMWIMPTRNVINPKSANLKIVNTAYNCKNLVPSKISWLLTGEKFQNYNFKKTASPKQPLNRVSKNIIKTNKKTSLIETSHLDSKINEQASSYFSLKNFGWLFILLIILLLKILSK